MACGDCQSRIENWEISETVCDAVRAQTISLRGPALRILTDVLIAGIRLAHRMKIVTIVAIFARAARWCA